MIEALLFDFDGLIVDTEWPLLETWQSVFADHGAELTHADFVHSIGTRGAIDWGELLAAKTGRPGPTDAQLRAAKDPRELQRAAHLTLQPGVLEWLDDATRHGLSCAVASSSGRDWIVPFLERFAIGHHFAAMATWEGDDCGYPPKPAPDIYQLACSALSVTPDAAIALEDSPNGVAAAKAAGLFCVAVPSRITEGLDFSAADVVVPSLASFTLADALVSASA